jgi:hypothetical protein
LDNLRYIARRIFIFFRATHRVIKAPPKMSDKPPSLAAKSAAKFGGLSDVALRAFHGLRASQRHMENSYKNAVHSAGLKRAERNWYCDAVYKSANSKLVEIF